jgi:hypothetical protein
MANILCSISYGIVTMHPKYKKTECQLHNISRKSDIGKDPTVVNVLLILKDLKFLLLSIVQIQNLTMA